MTTPAIDFLKAFEAAGLRPAADAGLRALATVLQKTVDMGVRRIYEGDLVDIAREASGLVRRGDSAASVSARTARQVLQSLVDADALRFELFEGGPSWTVDAERIDSPPHQSAPLVAPDVTAALP